MRGAPPRSGEAGVTGVCLEVRSHIHERHHVVHARALCRRLLEQCVQQQPQLAAVLPGNGRKLAAAGSRSARAVSASSNSLLKLTSSRMLVVTPEGGEGMRGREHYTLHALATSNLS